MSELTTKGEESSGNVLTSIVNTVTGSADESALPAGFSLYRRKVGGKEQSGTGNTITGEIVAIANGQIPADNTLEFINKYSVISVPVEKKWVGPAAAKATVRLLADGEDTGKKAELSKSNSWKHTFEGLPKYSKSGSVIDYAVAEDPVRGLQLEGHRRRRARLHRDQHLHGQGLGARREEVGRPGGRQGHRAPARRRRGHRQEGRAVEVQ